jgi:DNA uptake protein ComE-like DNA-binding protein
MEKRPLREYFTFTKRERTGILVLLALIGLCRCVPLVWEAYVPAAVDTDSTLLAEVAVFEQQLKAADTVTRRGFSYTRNRYTVKREQPAARYRQHFHRDSLLPRRTYTPFPERPARKPVIVAINAADSAAWEALPGIGPVLAARIVRFRDKLGGFYSITQVAETYGLADSTFKKIQSSLRADSVSLKKVNINKMDEQSLAKHPYIRYKLARLIIRYRSVHGPFSGPEALMNIPLVDDSIYRKLEPYISY